MLNFGGEHENGRSPNFQVGDTSSFMVVIPFVSFGGRTPELL